MMMTMEVGVSHTTTYGRRVCAILYWMKEAGVVTVCFVRKKMDGRVGKSVWWPQKWLGLDWIEDHLLSARVSVKVPVVPVPVPALALALLVSCRPPWRAWCTCQMMCRRAPQI